VFLTWLPCTRSFAFHFGSRDAPGVGKAMDACAKRTGRNATHAFAIGDRRPTLRYIRMIFLSVDGLTPFYVFHCQSPADPVFRRCRAIAAKLAQAPARHHGSRDAV
jgi:hypothetical protein